MSEHQYWLAYGFVVLAGFWALGQWGCSDSRKQSADNLVQLKQRAEKSTANPKKILEYARAGRQYRLRQCALVASVLSITMAGLFWVHTSKDNYELSLPNGRLYPANDPMPPHDCGSIKDNDYVLFLGSNEMLVSTFPRTIIQVNGEKRLVLNKGADGALTISLDLFNKAGDLIARIEEGHYTVNLSNQFGWKPRKDWNSLEIMDTTGTQVLSLRYINPRGISIDAILRYPGRDSPITFSGTDSTSNSKRETGEFRYEHNCIGNAFFIIENGYMNIRPSLQ